MANEIPSIAVRLAESADFQAINSLFNLVFQQNRSMDEFRWKFRESPWSGDGPPAVIGMLEEQLVGCLCFLPHQLIRHGELIDAIQVLDVCVHPNYRQCGVNRATLEFFLKNGSRFGRFAFGFPGQLYAAIGFETLGYRPLTSIVAHQFNRGCERAIADDGASLGLAVEDEIQIPGHWSTMISECNQRFGITTPRTIEYLRWRYRPFPNRQFRFVTARRKGSVEGLAVARIKSDGPISEIWIYELLAITAKAVQTLLQHLSCIGPLDQSSRIVYWCSECAPWQQELQQFGFQRVDQGPGHAVGVILGPADSRLDYCFNASEWFLTLGDTDL